MKKSKIWRHLSAALLGLLICSSLAFAQEDEVAPPIVAKKTFQEWSLPENALFFKSDDAADWRQTPFEEREWIQVGSLSKNLFIALDPGDALQITRRGEYEVVDDMELKTQLREKVLAELSYAIHPDWLPAPEQMVVASLTHRSGAVRQVAHCAFSGAGFNGLYIATLGKDFWLYLEQVEPLPAGAKPIQAGDILDLGLNQTIQEPDSEWATRRVGVQSREFIRYRAYLPDGPYQRVRILLIHCRFADALNFRSFGYPG